MTIPRLGLSTELPSDWRSRFGFVYIIKNGDLYKIGSARKPHKRIAQLRTAAPFLEELHHIPSLRYRELEHLLHVYYRNRRVKGEWFVLTDEDMDFIATIDGEGNQLKELRQAIQANNLIAAGKKRYREIGRRNKALGALLDAMRNLRTEGDPA